MPAMTRVLLERGIRGAARAALVLALGCENDPRLVGLESVGGAAGSTSAADAGVGGSPSTGGASGAPTSPEVIPLTMEDLEKTVSAALGQEIDVTLQTIGPGQFAAPELSSSAVEFIEMSFPPNQNPGGPTQLYRFNAVSSGTVVITIKHTVADSVFTVTVTVG
jgi:hypothetical protein